MKWMKIIGLTLALISTSAWSQGSDQMDWKITPYLWLVSIDGDIGIGPIDQNIELSFGDILQELDIGGQVYAEVGKDKHAFHIDYTYMRIKPDPTELASPPFPPDSELSTKMTVNLFEPAYNFRWKGPGGPALVVGARLIDMDLRLSPENLASVNVGPSWWDYFLGIKTQNIISTKWGFDFYGTIGTGGSDLPWTLQATFARRYSNDNRLMLGFRVWGVDYSEIENTLNTELDLTFYGFTVGYEFN
jgi:hypothetical protein